MGDPEATIKAMGERIQNISDSSEKADQVIVLGIRRMLTQAINYEYQLILKNPHTPAEPSTILSDIIAGFMGFSSKEIDTAKQRLFERDKVKLNEMRAKTLQQIQYKPVRDLYNYFRIHMENMRILK